MNLPCITPVSPAKPHLKHVWLGHAGRRLSAFQRLVWCISLYRCLTNSHMNPLLPLSNKKCWCRSSSIIREGDVAVAVVTPIIRVYVLSDVMEGERWLLRARVCTHLAAVSFLKLRGRGHTRMLAIQGTKSGFRICTWSAAHFHVGKRVVKQKSEKYLEWE